MEFIKLLGILIIIIGFALKKDAILIILASAIVTALVGGLGISGLLTTLGESFVNNRSIGIFIIIIFVTSTLEKNGLKEVAKSLISKLKNVSSGIIIAIYGIMRGFFAALNVQFGGVAGFVGAIESKGKVPNEEHVEQLKGMCSGMENIANFFCNVVFIGSPGALLVQSALKDLGYNVDLVSLAKVEIPIAIFALIIGIAYYYFKDKNLFKKYYKN